jgi:ubiquinone/menaquinone biosynthesis C-methylase UbiE
MRDVAGFYEGYSEGDRLTRSRVRSLEKIGTMACLEKYLVDGGKVADLGAGEGAYAFELAKRGQDVLALDITPKHVEAMAARVEAEKLKRIRPTLGDATDLSALASETFDLVLLFGPYYHLRLKSERAKCLAECARVVKRGGIVAVAYINRGWAIPYYFKSGLPLSSEVIEALQREEYTETFGFDKFLDVAFFSTPRLVESELAISGLEVVEHVATDGPYAFLADEIDKLGEEDWKTIRDYHLSVYAEPESLGMSNHGLAIGRKKALPA